MRKSIFYRNLIVTAGIVFLSFLVLGTMVYLWSYGIIMHEKQRAMSNTSSEVVKYVSAMSNGYELSGFELRMSLAAFSKMSGFDIMIADSSGVVISNSDMKVVSRQIGRIVPADALTQIKNGQQYSRITDLDGIYSERRYVLGSQLSLADGSNNDYIFISSGIISMQGIWRQYAGSFLLISLMVMIMMFVITFVTTMKQVEPLKEMAQAARRFARGDFAVRVRSENRADEIGQLTEAFNSMADSLEHSEMLRRDFIANVSHELKTPMTTISGFSDGILDGTIPPENERKYLEIISSETKRLSRLVRKMLEMSRIQSKTTDQLLSGSFDAAEVIRQALIGLGGKIDGKGLDVNAELPEEPVVTRGDKDAITQVTYNLIDNAVKFASAGSTLHVSLWKQGAKAYISVENHGETIPADELPLIFDRFHKTDRSRSEDRDGVGLGLYIVKTILNNHNEDVRVTSSDGVTAFTFTLTLAPTEGAHRIPT